MRKLIYLIILILFLAACRSDAELATLTAIAGDLTPVASEQVVTDTPVLVTLTTPTQEIATWTPEPTETPEIYAPAFDGFVPLNDNPYLDNVTIRYYRRSVVDGWTAVAVPEGYTHFWMTGNADGGNNPELDGATIIPVIERQQGLVFDIGGRAAKSGYAMDIEIDGITQSNSAPVCLFIQWFGIYAIEDENYDTHVQNYWFHAFADNNRGRQESLWVRAVADEPAANIAPYWTLWVTSNGTYTITAYIDMRYATSAPNHTEPDNWVSWFLLRSLWAGIDTQGGHCDHNTPML